MSTALGRKAEMFVEQWFEMQGWQCFERNLRVPGGEIDRLFVRERGVSGLRVDLCVAEVKATRLKRETQLNQLFSAARIRSLVKPNQLRTVWRSAAVYEGKLRSATRNPVRTFVRYFMVVFASRSHLLKLRCAIRKSGVDTSLRCCFASSEYMILSWSPEVLATSF
ncbi:MAG: hypothetical protein RJB13_148 [Pseudomonadota bacterium]|jgi:Holliday junction resolvase-like predicted endonuclease